MPRAICLRVSPRPDGTWELQVDDRSTRPVHAVVDGATVTAVKDRVRRLLAHHSALALAGRDVSRTRAEIQAGQALAGLIESSAPVARHLALSLAGGDEPPLIVVDAGPGAQELPWELLAGGTDQPPLETTGRAVIARQTTGRPAAHGDPGERLEVLLWCPTPEDPACAARLGALTEMAASLGLPAPVQLARDGAGAPVATSSSARVLHVVCHGRRAGGAGGLLLEDGERAADTVGHWLSSTLPTVQAVLLDVCEGGAPTPAELDGLAGRLVAAGAVACLAPLRRVSVQAAERFASGVYRALERGESLREAAARGRLEVRRLAVGHEASRWCNHALYVGDVAAVAGMVPVSRSWRPDGWPRPAPEVTELLDRAGELAREGIGGFVGLEHLLLALRETPGGGAVAARLRYGVVSVADALRERLALLAPQGEPATDLATTPRLEGYGAQLDEGFGLDALCEAIADDRHHALHELVGLDLGEAMRIQAADGSTLGLTLDSQLTPTERGTRHRGAVGLALEVVGGPEDGMLLRPKLGEVVGRWHRSRVVDLPLYQGATCTDLRLSRRHLGWLGSGVVRVARGGRLLRQLTASTYDRGEVALQHLDLVQLTAATWVRVVAPDRAG